MLFLWSKEPAPSPRAGPWFAWFATAVVLWRCRRRITNTILAVSPLRLLKRRTAVVPASPRLTANTTTSTQQLHQEQQQNYHHHHHHPHNNHHQHYRHRPSQQPKEHGLVQKHKATGIRTRVKRLCTGDGPHVSSVTSMLQSSQQIHYRVTRSGRVYGRYPNKIVATN